MNKKTYYLGYNRYEQKAIVYSTAEHAERGSSWWRVVEAHTLEDAKKQFLQEYRDAHTEHE